MTKIKGLRTRTKIKSSWGAGPFKMQESQDSRSLKGVPSMKIGLFAINYGTCGDPASAIRVAEAAEEAGFESVWTGEHIVLPDPMLPSFPLPRETPMLDTIVALTWIAAHTKRLRIASGIIIL